jgi:hypothetical protein
MLRIILFILVSFSAGAQLLNNNVLLNQKNVVELISSAQMDILNRYIDVTFDPNAYGSDGVSPVDASDLSIAFSQNGGTAINVAISSLSNDSGGALVGGESTIRVHLTITGTPDGNELINVRPSVQGSIRDSFGRYISNSDGTGDINLEIEYDAMYKAGLLHALTNDVVVPVKSQRLVDNELFVGWRSDGGVLSELDGLHLFTSTHNDWSAIDFVTATSRGSFTGTVVMNQFIGGEVISPVTGHFDTGWDPYNDGIKFLQNDASVVTVINSNGSSSGVAIGMRGNSALGGANYGHVRILPRNASNQATGAVNINSTGNTTVASGVTDSEGVHMVSREASNLTKQYLNGTQIDDGTTVSNSMSDRNMYVWAFNANGSAANYSYAHTIMMAMWGSGMQDKTSEINSRLQTWKTNTTALVPSISGKLYAVIGQSNADRSGLLSELSPGEAAIYNNGPISMANGYDANCWIWWDDEWQLLEPGVNGVDKSGGGVWFGAIYAIAVKESIKYPGEDLFFLHHAIGGTGMRASDGGVPVWLPGGTYSSSYETFIREYNNAVAAMTSVTAHMKPFWFQGEADATRANDSQDYGPINMAGAVVFTNSATLSAVNGSTSLTTSAAHGVTVGQWVGIEDVWYKAVTGTTGTTLVLERAYEGATGTVANADLLKANATGGDNNEDTMMDAIKANTGFTEFIVARIHNSISATNYPYKSRIRAHKQANIEAGTYGAGGVIIDVDDLTFRTGDSPHLSCTSSIELADRVSNEL